MDNVNKNKLFSIICYLVLMDNYNEKHPNYVMEKSVILSCKPWEAFTFLDPVNQCKVLKYWKEYNLDLPKDVFDYIVSSGNFNLLYL